MHEFAKKVWYPRIMKLHDATRIRYETAYVNHIRPALGNLRIKEIKFGQVQGFVNALSEKQVSRSGKGKVTAPMAPKSVHLVYVLLSNILKLAEHTDTIHKTPCNSLVTLPKLPEKRERVLSTSEAADILEGTPADMKLPVFCAMLLGMRLGEIVGLRWEDLDRQKRTLSIARQVNHKGTVTTLKSRASKRTLILPQEFVDFIDAHGDLDSLTICPLDRRALEHAWKRRQILPDGWTFHDLRHGAAGLIEAAMGGNVVGSQAVLGHARPDMTSVYIGRNEALTEAALSGLTSVLTSKKGLN